MLPLRSAWNGMCCSPRSVVRAYSSTGSNGYHICSPHACTSQPQTRALSRGWTVRCAGQDDDSDRLISMMLASAHCLGQKAYEHNCGRFSKRVLSTKLKASGWLRSACT